MQTNTVVAMPDHPPALVAEISAKSQRRKALKRQKASDPQPREMSRRMKIRTTLQRGAGLVLAGVATSMTTVSLEHTATGLDIITHGAIPTWEAWGVAVGIDINYVGMEFAGVVAAMQHVRERLHKFTKWGIPAVMSFSMAMNALGFAHGATNTYELVASVAAGIILPGLVWLAFRIAAILADI